MVTSKGAIALTGEIQMVVYILDYGDDYERTPFGVARNLTEARAMARAYLAALPYPASAFDYFGVVCCVAGELAMGDREDLPLD